MICGTHSSGIVLHIKCQSVVFFAVGIIRVLATYRGGGGVLITYRGGEASLSRIVGGEVSLPRIVGGRCPYHVTWGREEGTNQQLFI